MPHTVRFVEFRTSLRPFRSSYKYKVSSLLRRVAVKCAGLTVWCITTPSLYLEKILQKMRNAIKYVSISHLKRPTSIILFTSSNRTGLASCPSSSRLDSGFGLIVTMIIGGQLLSKMAGWSILMLLQIHASLWKQKVFKIMNRREESDIHVLNPFGFQIVIESFI